MSEGVAPDSVETSAWRVPNFAVTIRGKIVLAFCAFAALTGFLGLSAFNSVVDAGRLVVETYDKPLMSISYARLALSNFMAMELASMRRRSTADAAARAALDKHIDDLARAVAEDLSVAEARSTSVRPATLAHETARAVAAWVALRQHVLTAPRQGADDATLDSLAASVLSDLDGLVEITAEDGFKGREHALASIAAYRRLSLAATLGALLLGAVVAALLVRRMIQPIATASRAARRIAEGQLDVEIIPAGGDELGQLLGSMAVMRDNIRGMMEREIMARRSAQARLVNAIESSEEGVILVDDEGRTVISNSQLASFFPGLADGFVPGALLPAPLEAALAQPAAELRLADGRWLRLNRSGSPDGGFVVIASDITALKERETALRAAKEQAEAASRAKTEFVANMSHELRTPLNAVIGFSEIIADEMFGPVGQPKYKEFARDIGRSGNHLLEVINHILDIAKLQAGKMELSLRPTRVGEVIEDAVRIINERAQSRGITLTCEVEEHLALVEADPTRLRQVLLNLLSNAIKFTPERGLIMVTARRDPDGVRIVVSDTGIGMDAKDIPKALEPFSQIDSSLARKYEGTGLGLPLSKLYTEQHGGRLSIESTPGRGTKVSVVLPATAPKVEPFAVAI